MEYNFVLNGDEARALMRALATSHAALSTQMTINLWMRLDEISHVQPPQQKVK